MILPSRSNRMRPAYTLLEVTLAAAIGVLIMYGLYTAIDVQISSADAGREKVEQATLARSLLTRISNDITPCVGLADAGRYRRKNAAPAATTTPSTTTPSTTTPATTTPMTGADMTGTAAATDMTATTEEQPLPPIVQVIGNSTTLTLFVTRLPPNNAVNPQFGDVPVSDQRRIIYWMASGETGAGLARQEIPLVTADSFSEPSPIGTGDESRYIIADEVRNIGFEYFDGSAWQAEWQGDLPGADGKTPKGPPLAIRITIELAAPNSNPDEEPVLKTYTHTVAIPTANGLPQATEDPTMTPTMP